jgi:nucleotidyltransferase/DNA polymerase involved in DNA repair
LAFLQQHFGKSGAWYQAIANGEDDRPVVPNRPRKSSGSETTFANDLTDPAGIEAGVLAMADQVWTWCEKANAFGRTVTIKIKYADFRQHILSNVKPRTKFAEFVQQIGRTDRLGGFTISDGMRNVLLTLWTNSSASPVSSQKMLGETLRPA